jgi:hypothetical protein
MFMCDRAPSSMVTDAVERPALAGCRTIHRASYILERGMWNATCRGCGWQTSSPKRQLTASVFRLHIQAMRIAGRVVEAVVAAPEPPAAI